MSRNKVPTLFTSTYEDKYSWHTKYPAQTLEALAMSPALRAVRISNTLNKETRRRLIAEKSGLSANNVKSINNAINYKDAANVWAKLDQTARWLGRQVGTTNYAIMAKHPGVIFGSNKQPRSVQVKSDVWLMHKAIDGIKRWPVAFTTNKVADILEAYVQGARAFVLMDDASYSGSYLQDFVKPFSEFLDMHDWDRTHPKPRMYVTAAYASPMAIAKVDYWARPHKEHIKYYFPGSMKLTADYLKGLPNNQRRRVSNFLLSGMFDDQSTLALMAHKVPNFLSFPEQLGHALNDSLIPPYKQVNVNFPLLKKSTRKNNNTIEHEYHGGRIWVYKNKGGQLHMQKRRIPHNEMINSLKRSRS